MSSSSSMLGRKDKDKDWLLAHLDLQLVKFEDLSSYARTDRRSGSRYTPAISNH